MPVYEYQCTTCGERTQRLQEMGEDSTGRRCLSCDNGTIRKVFSVFGIPGSVTTDSCAPGGESRFT